MGRRPKTLQAMDRVGAPPAKRTAPGRRYWLKRDLDQYLGRTSAEGPRRGVAYGRVSWQAERADRNNPRRIVEDFCLAKGIAHVEFLEEIGGGLNVQRPTFLALVDSMVSGEIWMRILAPQGGLARFGYDLRKQLCSNHGGEWLVWNAEEVSPEQEMVQDLRAIAHCFSSRLWGLRNCRQALKEVLPCTFRMPHGAEHHGNGDTRRFCTGRS
jgi:predicted site-specific integrase-resolvase